MQLVLSNNRIIAHGENFLAMGGVVINTANGKKYENATLAECNGCPSDIDEVGYEYHAGVFVPCAPYGKAEDGTILVGCEDCKTPKDSGIPVSSLINVQTGSYVGNGTIASSGGYTGAVSLPCEKCPKMVVINSGASVAVATFIGSATDCSFNVIFDDKNASFRASISSFTASYDGTAVVWETTTADACYCMNKNGIAFKYALIY
jgi:hypothetical protein